MKKILSFFLMSLALRAGFGLDDSDIYGTAVTAGADAEQASSVLSKEYDFTG